MKKLTKKEIQKLIQDAINKVGLKLNALTLTRRSEKLLEKFSRKYAAEVKRSIKKNGLKTVKGKPTKKSRQDATKK